MLAIDVSNYTDSLTPERLAAWQAADVGLVIIQAFPPTYRQYVQQRAQMQACAAVGMPFDCYVYDYLGDPTWLSGALDGIDQSPEKPRMVWLDEEDVETERGWSRAQRAAVINENLLTVLTRGHDEGIYTGSWWWNERVGGEQFADHKLWAAQYDGIADAAVLTPFGGWTACAVKQYQGTSTFGGVSGVDVNVLSVEEEAELTGGGQQQTQEGDVHIPQEYVTKFQLPDDNSQAALDGLINNLEGVISTVREQASAEGADDAAKLARIKEIVAA